MSPALARAMVETVRAARVFDLGGGIGLEHRGGMWAADGCRGPFADVMTHALWRGADPARCEAVRAALVACDADGEGLPW